MPSSVEPNPEGKSSFCFAGLADRIQGLGVYVAFCCVSGLGVRLSERNPDSSVTPSHQILERRAPSHRLYLWLSDLGDSGLGSKLLGFRPGAQPLHPKS